MCSDVHQEARRSVKVTLKDLLLHSVWNDEVLDSMKEICSVTSPVNYSNLWHKGKVTNICNGDRFLYVYVQDVLKLPQTVQIGGYQSWVFKPESMSTCKWCGNEGHHPSDPNCQARTSEEIQDTIEVFCGGKCELSNLHKCPEGCEISDMGTTFNMSEHHYQFKKLKAHDKGIEAYEMLIEDSFKAMKKAKAVLPDSEVSEDWK